MLAMDKLMRVEQPEEESVLCTRGMPGLGGAMDWPGLG